MWVIKQTHNHLSEGAVVGIVFGWMVPIIGLYILGIFIICKCLKNRKKEEKSSKDKGS